MFTGLVQAQGVVESWSEGHLSLNCPEDFLQNCCVGDSLAVDGVCLTVTDLSAHCFHAYVAPESISLTHFADLSLGDKLNLEKCLTLQDFIGGHLVTGHVDGTARCFAMDDAADSKIYHFQLAKEFLPFIARKGSVTINGVSLTVTAVSATDFSVMLIPHTQAVTNLGQLALGSLVNVEVDLLARYCQRLLTSEVSA